MASPRSASEVTDSDQPSGAADAPATLHVTRCPHCATDFEVPEEIWNASDTRVVCGECSHLFDAVVESRPTPSAVAPSVDGDANISQTFVDEDDTFESELDYTLSDFELFGDEEALPVASFGDPTPATGKSAIDTGQDSAAASDGGLAGDASALTADNGWTHPFVAERLSPGDGSAPASHDTRAAAAGESKRPRRSVAAWRFVLPVCAVVISSLLLATIIKRNAPLVYNNTLFRPLALLGCRVLACEVPARVALDELVLIQRALYSHPTEKDVLVIDASFVNQADFAQRFPVLRLRLSDAEGGVVLTRRFEPAEYWAHWQSDDTLAPAQRIDVQLLLDDPGQAAATFEMTFAAF